VADCAAGTPETGTGRKRYRKSREHDTFFDAECLLQGTWWRISARPRHR
jgi:hypothetical protein